MKKQNKKIKYILDVPISFVEYCYRNAKTKRQKQKIKEILESLKEDERNECN